MKPLTAKGAFIMPKISNISVEKEMERFGSRGNFPPPEVVLRRSDRPTETCRSISKNSRFQLRSYQNLDRNEIESCDPVGKLLSIEKCSSIFSWFLTSPAGLEHG